MAKTMTMVMAKADKKDISELSEFFTTWELLESENWHLEEDDWDEEEWAKLKEWQIGGFKNEYQYEKNINQLRTRFFETWFQRIDYRWRRVVIGADLLIDQCCDPNLDHLAWKPEIIQLMEASEAS